MRWIADRYVQLVRRKHAKNWVPKLPPELMANSRDFHSCRWFRSVLYSMDHASRRPKQNDHDQNWNDGPREFNLSASVYLRRLAPRFARPAPKFNDGIRQQRRYHGKNQGADPQHEPREVKDRISRRRVRLENASHRVSGVRTGAAQSRGKKNPGKDDEHPGDSPHDTCPVSGAFPSHSESLMRWRHRAAIIFSTDTHSSAQVHLACQLDPLTLGTYLLCLCELW